MSSFIPEPALSAAAAPARGGHALDEPREHRRVGLVGTLVVHGLLVALILWLPADLLDGDAITAPMANPTFQIELSPALAAAPATTAPEHFVEVNPAAPENVPDQTAFMGAQNQQVAQPVPTPDGASDTPLVAGDGQAHATAVVSGQTQAESPPSAAEALASAFTPPEPVSLVPEKTVAERPPARAVNSLPGGEQLLGAADGGVGSTVTTLPLVSGAETGTEPARGTAAGRAATGGYFSGTPAIDRTRPQERPHLSAATVNARTTPTIKNEFGSKNIGAVAYNAKWSAYGEYMQRLIDAVQVQWERLLLRSAYYPASGSQVRVVFKLNATGAVAEIVKVDGSGAELAQRLCVSAITERAPYGEWSEDMRAALGDEQEISFTFFYQ